MNDRVLVIGAGVAGISAALWLRDLKVPFDWFERGDQLGGTLHVVYNPIHNQLGGVWSQGAALTDDLRAQLLRLGLAPTFGAEVLRLRAQAEDAAVRVEARVAGAEVKERWGAVLIATGTDRRYLGIPGEQHHMGRGVARSGTHERDRFAGRRVVVVGGGDAAFENALILAALADHVLLVHRSDQYRARPEFIQRVQAHPRIDLLPYATLTAIEADPDAPFLTALHLDTPQGHLRHPAEGLLVRIGVHGVHPDVRVDGHPLTSTDEHYLITDPFGRTHHPRILALGDCTCPDFRAVAVAAGQGARAARTAAFAMGYYG